jgi:serine/threonine-protein kinase
MIQPGMPPMQAERFARIRALYQDVIDCPPEQRAALLSQQNVPADIAAEVLALCRASDDSDTAALNRPRNALLGEAIASQPAIGDVFGAWRVVAEIGHGGMGRVFRVERNDGHYTQTAALKFIKGVAAEAAIALFARERQLLARLQHPRIARLIDGGATPEGRPFLVMDYIDGQPIDAWCREHRPSRDALLDVFVAACGAVSHAHRQLVVHCDLKPSNILVTAAGEPVLLDFGIAQLSERISDAPAPDAAGAASAGYTPRYASPEQRRGERVSTASDVYSLGVVLGEMIERAGLGADRELAALIARATHAQASSRYASVDALCDDIARLRALRPLQALPATAGYRLSKFVRRRWAALLGVAGVLALCLGFTLQLISERQRALAAEQIALAERDRARQSEIEARASEATARETNGFLISVFRGGHADAGSGLVSLSNLLDEAMLRIETDLAGTPATQSQMMATLARVLFVIGQPDRGQQLYARAIELERGQQRPLVLAEMLISNAHELRRDRAAQIDHASVLEALRLVDMHAAAGSPLHFELRLNAASILGQGRRPEADAVYAATLQEAREHHPGSVALSNALAAYGWHLRRLNDFPRAIALMRESLDLRRLLLGDTHVEYVTQLEALAGTLQLARRFAEAEPLFVEALALHRRDGRLASRQGAWSLVQYATMLAAAGRADEAIPLFEEAFEIGQQKFPDDSPSFAIWKHNLADAVAAIGDVPRATAIVDEAIATMETQGPGAHRRLARSLILQARILSQNVCDAAAGAAVDRALHILTSDPAPDGFDLADAWLVRAQWLQDCGRHGEARALLEALLAAPAQLRPGTEPYLKHALARADLWRDGDALTLSKLIDAEHALAAIHAPGDPRLALARLPRAEWLQAQDRRAESSALATAIETEIGDRLVADAPLRRRIAELRDAR